MNYIILDLEYNQPMPKQYELNNRNSKFRMTNEIIEIGAVKLDDDFNFVKGFKTYVKPYFQQLVHPKVLELLDITESELYIKGVFFMQASRLFKEFIGDEDFNFITWGNNDLGILKTNYAYHKYEYNWFKDKKAIDVQDLYMKYNNLYDHISLEKAVSNLGINIRSDFHKAYNDAFYTSKIIQTMGKDKIIHAKRLLWEMEFPVPNNRIPNVIKLTINKRLHCSCGKFMRKVKLKDPYYLENKSKIKFSALGFCQRCQHYLDFKYVYYIKNELLQVNKPSIYKVHNKKSLEYLQKIYGEDFINTL